MEGRSVLKTVGMRRLRHTISYFATLRQTSSIALTSWRRRMSKIPKDNSNTLPFFQHTLHPSTHSHIDASILHALPFLSHLHPHTLHPQQHNRPNPTFDLRASSTSDCAPLFHAHDPLPGSILFYRRIEEDVAPGAEERDGVAGAVESW